ncbi:unnamed protein product [Pleuronectes platessa]|uniref:Uncharacterized protein n=1 Tax=Pleuronectes platessa TaxID=8262 RepID=A0A9N7YV86_PLEPL|nr:unnamed protein product [Pleuronectes platessa]
MRGPIRPTDGAQGRDRWGRVCVIKEQESGLGGDQQMERSNLPPPPPIPQRAEAGKHRNAKSRQSSDTICPSASYWSPERTRSAGNQDPRSVLWRTRSDRDNRLEDDEEEEEEEEEEPFEKQLDPRR